MTKHMVLRKLIGINNHRRLADGRYITVKRIDVKLGQVPVAICQIDGRLCGLTMNDPEIKELLEQK